MNKYSFCLLVFVCSFLSLTSLQASPFHLPVGDYRSDDETLFLRVATGNKIMLGLKGETSVRVYLASVDMQTRYEWWTKLSLLPNQPVILSASKKESASKQPTSLIIRPQAKEPSIASSNVKPTPPISAVTSSLLRDDLTLKEMERVIFYYTPQGISLTFVPLKADQESHTIMLKRFRYPEGYLSW